VAKVNKQEGWLYPDVTAGHGGAPGHELDLRAADEEILTEIVLSVAVPVRLAYRGGWWLADAGAYYGASQGRTAAEAMEMICDAMALNEKGRRDLRSEMGEGSE
jgi:hypothetical protein